MRAFIITGGRGSGKTTLLTGAIARLRSTGLRVAGILSPGVLKEGQRHGFDVVDLRTGAREVLSRRDGDPSWVAIGSYRFSPRGLMFGRSVLDGRNLVDAEVVAIDEVGRLELQGEGWAPCLDALDASTRTLLVVRDEFLEAVQTRWEFTPERVWRTGIHLPEEIAGELVRIVRGRGN